MDIPKKLAALVAAFGQKLTGEQLAECLNEADRMYDPTLTYYQRRVCDAVMADDDMAQWYGFERAQNLEKLRDLRVKCHFAIEALTKMDRSWHDQGMLSDLRGIASAAENACSHYDRHMKELSELVAKID